MKLLDIIENIINWVLEHPFLTIVLIYCFACFVNLCTPIDTNRGSWWNVFYWLLVAIS